MKLSQMTGKEGENVEIPKYVKLKNSKDISVVRNTKIDTFQLKNMNIEMENKRMKLFIQPGKINKKEEFIPIGEIKVIEIKDYKKMIQRFNERRSVDSKGHVIISYVPYENRLAVCDMNGNRREWEKVSGNKIKVYDLPPSSEVMVRYKTLKEESNEFSNIMLSMCSKDTFENNILNIIGRNLDSIL